MKIIIVSQRIDFISHRTEIRDCIDQRLTNFLLQGGYLPITIPNIFFITSKIKYINYFEDWLRVINPDGILLSGGNNIGEFKSRDNNWIWN